MTKDGFVHLHTHTEYSLLDGAARIDDLVKRVVVDCEQYTQQPAIGITDHGNLYGVIPFYQTCQQNGVKPIIGCEVYMAAENVDERPKQQNSSEDTGSEGGRPVKNFFHLTLLAMNNVGYHNLLKLSSRTFLEGFWRKPRCDWDMLSDHAEGLLATTGCLGSVVHQSLMIGDISGAKERVSRLRDIFGAENLYAEIQDHGIPEQKSNNIELLKIARDMNVPLLGANDLHYVNAEDHEAHDVLLCIQTKATIAQPDRFRFASQQHWAKTPSEMRELFAELPDACDNTLAIAERADVTIGFGHDLLPKFPLPEGYDKDTVAYLHEHVMIGAKQRWGNKLSKEVKDRLDYELSTINDMKFTSYFLIVEDLIKHAVSSGISVGPGRGSAAGCAVAYALGITRIDPLKHGLLFERFLNTSRATMPDIDIDFDDRRRGEMVSYASEKYGKDKVAQVVTFQRIQARQAMRDAARVMEKPYSVGDKLAKAIPPLIMGRSAPLSACLDAKDPDFSSAWEAAADLRKMVASDSDARSVVEVARGLEGLPRGDSIHAAAVLISPCPIDDYIPLQRNREEGGAPVTQYDMHTAEELGFLKMDFLGLRTLTVIADAVASINKEITSKDEQIDIDNLPFDDENTYQLLRNGDGVGIFQLESGPMRQLMKGLEPDSFRHLPALLALYRPGPMASGAHTEYQARKAGRPYTIQHPDLEPVLGSTYGLMVYQEQIMEVAATMAGYSLVDADDMRKACGKKDRQLIAAHRTRFVEGSIKNGYDPDLANDIFARIEPFADYAFNKSHAYAYGLISYQCAYLKANYRPYFTAALLTTLSDNMDRRIAVLADARGHFNVLQPCVNNSNSNFTVDDNGDVRYGLAAIQKMGKNASEEIVLERERSGIFKSLDDFLTRCDKSATSTKVIASLARSGAFDNLGITRLGVVDLADNHPEKLRSFRKIQSRRLAGEVSLFDDTSEIISNDFLELRKDEATEENLASWEREALGLYLTRHPMNALEPPPGIKSINLLLETTSTKKYAQVMGAVTALTVKYTSKGEAMCNFVLDDATGLIDVVIFSRIYKDVKDIISEGSVLLVSGNITSDHGGEGTPMLIGNKIEIPLKNRKTVEAVTNTASQPSLSYDSQPTNIAAPPMATLVGDENMASVVKEAILPQTEIKNFDIGQQITETILTPVPVPVSAITEPTAFVESLDSSGIPQEPLSSCPPGPWLHLWFDPMKLGAVKLAELHLALELAGGGEFPVVWSPPISPWTETREPLLLLPHAVGRSQTLRTKLNELLGEGNAVIAQRNIY